MCPAADPRRDELVAVLRCLLDRGWDAHLLLEGDDPRDRPPRLGGLGPKAADRVHRCRDGRRAVRRTEGLLRALQPAVVHFRSADHARRRLHLVSRLAARTITRFSAHEASATGLGDADHYRPVWERSDLIEAPDAAVLARVRRRGCPAGTPSVVGPALVAPPPLPHRARDDGPARPLRVLSAGPLTWTQGYEHGLRAVSLLREHGVAVEWRVVGDGEDFAALAFGRHELEVADRMRFVRPATTAGRRLGMLWADVLLAPAVIDGLPQEVVEGCAAGLPVVMSDPGALGELTVPHDAAVTVARRDPPGLAAALGALAANAVARRRMGAAARRWAAERFTVEANVDGLETLYRRPLAVDGGWTETEDQGPTDEPRPLTATELPH